MDNDLLDSLLDLEERFCNEGYELGVSDGARAGYNEGSVFGVENGFEKFQEMGRLYGKAIIWAKRLPGEHGLLLPAQGTQDKAANEEQTGTSGNKAGNATKLGNISVPELPPLPANSRLEKHITTLLSLVDPLTLLTENTEDAVADFDDRLKKATAKVKVIEKILGEQNDAGGKEGSRPTGEPGESNIEDIGALPPRLAQMI